MSDNIPFLSAAQLLAIYDQTKTATAIHVGETAVIQAANNAMLKIWGKDRNVIGKSLEEALPELKGQPFIEMFAKVWREGLTLSGTDTAAELEIDGRMQTFYFDFEYRAIADENGRTLCILHTAIDVTERVLNREALQRAFEKEEALKREQALNEELAAANEELNAINEELHQSQENLSKLNEKLEARVADRVKELSESEERFRTMAEGTDILIAVGDETSNAIYFNTAWCKLTGRSMDELLQFGWTDLIHPEDKDEYVNIYLSAFEKQIPFTGEFRVKSKDGDYRWLLAQGPPRFRQDGSFAGYISSCTDITDLKKLQLEVKSSNEELAAINEELASINEEMTAANEELAATNEELAQLHDHLILSVNKLSESEEKLRQAIETGKMGTWSINPTTREVTMSTFVKELLGLPLDQDAAIADIMKAIHPDYHEMLFNVLENALTNHLSSDTEYPITNLITCDEKWVRATGKIFLNDRGIATEYSGMFMDITERKLDELRKNDFIGMVSHELKTPLTSLNGYLQILQRKASKESDSFSVSALETANKQIKKMTTMINGFLNISRLESGKIALNKSRFKLNELISAVAQEAMVLDSSHHITNECTAEIEIFGDYDKISNVLSNLLSNAVKYSPYNFEIEVKCAVINGMAQVSVKDNGLGIAKKDTEKLFERYYRVENNLSISGFGIGLYLSAEIIERHQGKIWVESKLDQGSTFYFSLPLAN